MKKYVVISCIEDEIYPPDVCDTMSAAFALMLEDMSCVLDIPLEDLKKAYEDGGEYDEFTMIDETSAFGKRYGNGCEWKIFEIEV